MGKRKGSHRISRRIGGAGQLVSRRILSGAEAPATAVSARPSTGTTRILAKCRESRGHTHVQISGRAQIKGGFGVSTVHLRRFQKEAAVEMHSENECIHPYPLQWYAVSMSTAWNVPGRSKHASIILFKGRFRFLWSNFRYSSTRLFEICGHSLASV